MVAAEAQKAPDAGQFLPDEGTLGPHLHYVLYHGVVEDLHTYRVYCRDCHKRIAVAGCRTRRTAYETADKMANTACRCKGGTYTQNRMPTTRVRTSMSSRPDRSRGSGM